MEEEYPLMKWLNDDCTLNLTDMVHIEGHPDIETTRKALLSCSKTKARFAVGTHIIIIIVMIALAAGAVIEWTTSLIICAIVSVSAVVSYFMILSGPWSKVAIYNNEVKELTKTFGSIYRTDEGTSRNNWDYWKKDIKKYQDAKEESMKREINKERNEALRNGPSQTSTSSTTGTAAALGVGALLGNMFSGKRGGDDDELNDYELNDAEPDGATSGGANIHGF